MAFMAGHQSNFRKPRNCPKNGEGVTSKHLGGRWRIVIVDEFNTLDATRFRTVRRSDMRAIEKSFTIAVCFFASVEFGMAQSHIQLRVVARFGIQEAKTKEDQPFQFSSIRNIEIGQNGDIYVLDNKDSCVKVFDQNGKFLRKMFGPGKGPQEINGPYYLKINRFSGNVFIVQEYGFQIKEFDSSGHYLKSHRPPKQIFYDFEFLDAGRAAFIVDAEDKADLSRLVSYNVEISRSERELGLYSVIGMSRAYQKLIFKDGILWTCPGDKMELLGFDIKKGGKTVALPIPEKYKESEIIRGSNMQAVRIYNFGQPFLISDRLYVCVTHQEFPSGADRPWHPKSRRVALYMLENSALQKVGELPDLGCFADIHAAWHNRLVVSSSGFDLFPEIIILELGPSNY